MKTLWTVLRHHPLMLVSYAFVAFSVLWTTTEALTYFFGWTALKDSRWLATMIFCSISYSMYKLWRPSKIVIRLPMTNVSIEVVFGDIFDFDGVAAIPVNEFFDSQLGLPVSPKSLHGIFIQRCYGGHGDAFDRQVVDKLAKVRAAQVQREQGKPQRFPIGTCAAIEAAGKHYLAFAFTCTDTKTYKGSADVPQMFTALSGLWQAARVELGGDALNLPLIGSGLSGVGLPARDLANILILSFIDETKRQIITQKMRIILARDRLDEVDLRELKKYWEGK